MFEQSRSQLHELVIKVQHKQKQICNAFNMEVVISDIGEIYVWDILRKVKEIFQFSDPVLFFYYDHLQEEDVCLHPDDHSFIHHSSLLNENMISIRTESQVSDQVLANPDLKPPPTRVKRSPERFIFEAFYVVESWRHLYRQGNKVGVKEKTNLDKAASILEIPRKTLEDYYLLIRNGASFGFNFNENKRQKIGVLRAFVRQKRKEAHSSSPNESVLPFQETKFLCELRKQIFGLNEQEQEKDLFSVVAMDQENGGSDEDLAEDIIFEN